MRDEAQEIPARLGLVGLGVATIVVAILAASAIDGSPLCAPGYWAWVLTGLQVAALRGAATGRSWGWLLGASVQLPWITYATVTAQFGFIPGCLISCAVQGHGYLRRRGSDSQWKRPTYA